MGVLIKVEPFVELNCCGINSPMQVTRCIWKLITALTTVPPCDVDIDKTQNSKRKHPDVFTAFVYGRKRRFSVELVVAIKCIRM